MAEAATESHEDPSEETEDMGPLEPEDNGKKTNALPALLPHFGYYLEGKPQPRSQFSHLYSGQEGPPTHAPGGAKAGLVSVRDWGNGRTPVEASCHHVHHLCLRYLPTSHKPPQHHGE